MAINRRTLMGGALVALLPFPERVMAGEGGAHADLIVLLLSGLYEPVADAPDLGLSTVDLNDGSYSKTKIYPVGLRGQRSVHDPIGDFYLQFAGDLCAYDLPGGAFSMRFVGSDTVFVDDGAGGTFLEGTFDLNVLEANGRFRSLTGGRNHMVDKLHFLPPGDGSGGIAEYCICLISRRGHDLGTSAAATSSGTVSRPRPPS